MTWFSKTSEQTRPMILRQWLFLCLWQWSVLKQPSLKNHEYNNKSDGRAQWKNNYITYSQHAMLLVKSHKWFERLHHFYKVVKTSFNLQPAFWGDGTDEVQHLNTWVKGPGNTGVSPARSFVVDLFWGGVAFSEMWGRGEGEGRRWKFLREILLMEEILHQLIDVRVISECYYKYNWEKNLSELGVVFFQKTFPQNCLSSPEVISLLKKRRVPLVGTDFGGQQKRHQNDMQRWYVKNLIPSVHHNRTASIGYCWWKKSG